MLNEDNLLKSSKISLDNHTREIKITRLVKQIKQSDMSVLTSSLKRKYLNLKRLLNERKSVSNIRREPYYMLMFNDKDNEESKHFQLQKYNQFCVADTHGDIKPLDVHLGNLFET